MRGVCCWSEELFQITLLRASANRKMIIYSSHAYKEFSALFDIETLVSDLTHPAVLGMAGFSRDSWPTSLCPLCFTVSTIVRFVKDSAGYQGTYYKVSLDNKQRIHSAFSPSSVADLPLSAIHREEP